MIGLDEKTEQSQEYRIVLDLPHDVREYYTLLRDRLMLSYKGNTQLLRTVAITSCQTGEGVSTVALNLAVTIAHHEKVLFIDADPEEANVFSALKEIPVHNSEAVEANVTPLINVANNLDVLSVALMDGDSPKQFESPTKLEKLLNSYRSEYDCIVIDTPPHAQRKRCAAHQQPRRWRGDRGRGGTHPHRCRKTGQRPAETGTCKRARRCVEQAAPGDSQTFFLEITIDLADERSRGTEKRIDTYFEITVQPGSLPVPVKARAIAG